MIFEGAKVQRQRKQTKAHNTPDLTYYFAILEIANLCPYLLPTRKSEKKRKKSHIFCLNILQILKIVVPLHRNQEKTRLLISREILLYLYCSQPPAMLRRCQRWRGEMTAKLTCPLCTQPTALAKMQACKVSEYKQKAINCISQKTE